MHTNMHTKNMSTFLKNTIKLGVRERNESEIRRTSILLSNEGLASSYYNNMPRSEEDD